MRLRCDFFINYLRFGEIDNSTAALFLQKFAFLKFAFLKISNQKTLFGKKSEKNSKLSMFNYILGFTGKQKLQTCLNISEELQF